MVEGGSVVVEELGWWRREDGRGGWWREDGSGGRVVEGLEW